MPVQKYPDMTKDQRLMFFLSRGLPIPDKVDLQPPASPFAPRKSDALSLQHAGVQVATLKTATYTTWARNEQSQGGMEFVPERTGTWADLSEMGKIAVLDNWVNWAGVSRRDKRIAFTKEIDASKLPQEVADHFLDMPKDRFLDRKSAGRPRGKKSLAELKAHANGRQPGRQKSRGRGMER